MSAPVINTATSVLGFKQYEEWEYQPSATGEPCLWSSSPLPAGLSMAAAPTAYATAGVAATDIITATASAFSNGNRVYFHGLTGGPEFAANTVYFVRDVSGATFKLAATLGGAAIDFSVDISAATLSLVQTGLISGAATEAGVYNVSVIAANADGPSAAALVLTIGIEPATGSLRSGADLFVDLQTGLVSMQGAADATPGAEGAPLFAVKEDDDLLLYVQFRRGETVVDLGAVTEMSFGLKELETESVVTLGGGADTGVDGTPFKVMGTGTDATYVLHVKFDGDAMAAALANYEADEGTSFVALAELTWLEPNPTTGDRVGPAELVRTSQTFQVRVVRDFVE